MLAVDEGHAQVGAGGRGGREALGGAGGPSWAGGAGSALRKGRCFEWGGQWEERVGGKSGRN